MSEYQNNSIFWVETTKIKPNPFQPRKEFEPKSLEDLADSIRQYGVLQPLVVTRKEILRPENHGMDVQYELIAGERRLRASKIAGLAQVPVIIRKETDDKVKLELAIIENLQREDLNPIDRALAFEQLYKQFKLTHVQIGKRMGKSRVYVSNSLRLLSLPEEIKQGLMAGKITEGHTRPLLMLIDRPQEQTTLYKEIMIKKMSVRDAEKVARSIAQDRVRKKEFKIDPRIRDYEKKLSENLGTRVHIEPKENGGQITIDYFALSDLEEILKSMKTTEQKKNMMERYIENNDSLKKNITPNNVTDLVNATGINIKKEEGNQLLKKYDKTLPEYSKNKDTDIQEYHEEISPLSKEEVSDFESIDTDPLADFGAPVVQELEHNNQDASSNVKADLDNDSDQVLQDYVDTIYSSEPDQFASMQEEKSTQPVLENEITKIPEFKKQNTSADYHQKIHSTDSYIKTANDSDVSSSPEIDKSNTPNHHHISQNSQSNTYNQNLPNQDINFQNSEHNEPQDSYDKPQYQYEQQYQAPKKKSFFSKLFS
jgi:ParB family chromosome partitioning protein